MIDSKNSQQKNIITFNPDKPSFLSLAEKLYHPSFLRQEGDGDDLLESDYYQNLHRILRRLNGRTEPTD